MICPLCRHELSLSFFEGKLKMHKPARLVVMCVNCGWWAYHVLRYLEAKEIEEAKIRFKESFQNDKLR